MPSWFCYEKSTSCVRCSHTSACVWFRRPSSSLDLRCVEEERCVVVWARHLPQCRWDTHRQHIRPLRRRPCSVQTRARCVRPHHPIVRLHLRSIRLQSRLATMPAIRWPVLVWWDRRERVDMRRAALQYSRHQSEWFRHCSSRPLPTEVHYRHQCMIFLSDPIFLVSMRTSISQTYSHQFL